MRQRRVAARAVDALHGALEQRHARTPDARFLEQYVEWLALPQPGLDLGQRAQFFAHCPKHQRRRFALLLQAVEGPRQAHHVAEQQGFAQTVEVVARDVEHGILHGAQRQFAGRMEQRELEDFLVRGEQIALDMLGDEAQTVAVGALLLAAQAAGDPFGQFGERRRNQLDGGTGIGEVLEPDSLFLGPVEPWQGDQQDDLGRGPRAVLLQGGSAFAARLAGRNAQIDQLAAAEQRHVAARVMQFDPVESGDRGEHFALVETAAAGGGAQRVGGLDDKQRLVAIDDVDRFQLTFQLRRIPLKAGAEVQAGMTVLAVIDPLAPALLDARSRTLAEARRDSASSSLEKARAGHAFAASELRRFEKLHSEKTVSIQELEAAQWREASAARDKAAAESALRQAEAELAEFAVGSETAANPGRGPTEVRAPANGRVLRVIEENARVVIAGTPLVEIGDPTDLEVVIEVLSRDGAALPAGAPVELDQWGEITPLEARVRLVEPAAFTKVSALGVEEQRVRVIADLLTPPDQRRGLGDNFRVEARIITWETNQTLSLPSGALFRQGKEWFAFVVADGHARLRPVKAGRPGGANTQILEGLKEGENVILYPGDRIRDGQRVRTIKI